MKQEHLSDQRLMLVTARDVNIPGIIVGWVVRIASLVKWASCPWVDAHFPLNGDAVGRCSFVERIVPTWHCSQWGLWIILSDRVMFSGKRHCCWICFFFWLFEHLERLTCLRPISPKLCNSRDRTKSTIGKRERRCILILNIQLKVKI